MSAIFAVGLCAILAVGIMTCVGLCILVRADLETRRVAAEIEIEAHKRLRAATRPYPRRARR